MDNCTPVARAAIGIDQQWENALEQALVDQATEVEEGAHSICDRDLRGASDQTVLATQVAGLRA